LNYDRLQRWAILRWENPATAGSRRDHSNFDRSGWDKSGYDMETLETLCEAVSIPVVANGGCRSPDDMVAAIKAGAHAVAASTMFLYDNVTPDACKAHLENAGIPVRIEA